MRLWDKSRILSELQSLKQPFTDEARFRDASTRKSDDGKDEPSSNASFLNKLYETSSDSFYFVGDKLIMHNKAFYKYVREDASAQCKSYEAKYGSSSKGEAKGAKNAGGGAKAEAKTSGGAGGGAKAEGKSDAWSKETDYF